jgi:hypothetical protein
MKVVYGLYNSKAEKNMILNACSFQVDVTGKLIIIVMLICQQPYRQKEK